MKQVKNLVVGCGLSGVVMAERLANVLHEPVLIIDKRNHIAGNIYDYRDKLSGILIHKYGPHVFHTNDKQVWEYLSTFTDWNHYMQYTKALVDGQQIPVPFNLNSLYQVFSQNLAENLEKKLVKTFGFNKKIPILELKKQEDPELSFLADYVYTKVFLGYTLKQWGTKPEDLDPSVTARVPVYISRDDRYFQDKYQGLPINGYTEMVKKMLANSLIELKLNTSWQDLKDSVSYERLFFTGPIDEFFGYKLGALPYRSLNFVFKTLKQEYYQKTTVINFPENYDFTRICEYKYFLNEKSDKTTFSIEYPAPYIKDKNEPYYPIPSKENENLYIEYKELSKQMERTYFLGRLGSYRYVNMDQAIKEALNLFEQIKNKV